MWQSLVVDLAVLVAVAYACWYLMPAALRRRLAVIRPALGKAPSCASACSDCGGCGPKPGADGPATFKSITITRR
ncbi:MAG: hypothetical protein ACTS8S_07025 [Giesbergeria sp.]